MNHYDRLEWEIDGVGWMHERSFTIRDFLYAVVALIGIGTFVYGVLLISAADRAIN